MNILVTGASGFIASHIITELLAAGHQVRACARNIRFIKNIFPSAETYACDFIRDTAISTWLPRLEGIDVVINCVGILYHPNNRITWAIHYDTPRALFDAAVKKGVKKLIQISALGVDKSTVEYAKSKRAAEEYLIQLPIKAIILRPSLVYGRGSYGGTSLFRGLASFPKVVPIPGTGEQTFQPIHVQDLAKAVSRLVSTEHQKSIILSAVGPQKVNLKLILSTLRAWLGFTKARLINIPLTLIRLGSRIGDFIPYSAMNSSSYQMLMQNNICSEAEAQHFHEVIGFKPQDYIRGVYHYPSSVQDRWHARLFFLKPILQMSIAFIWIWSAFASVLPYSHATAITLLAEMGIKNSLQHAVLYSASAIDLLLGIATMLGYQLKKVGILQIIIILIYSFIISWKLPYLWLVPFAPIAKNIPLIAATLILLALESDR